MYSKVTKINKISLLLYDMEPEYVDAVYATILDMHGRRLRDELQKVHNRNA